MKFAVLIYGSVLGGVLSGATLFAQTGWHYDFYQEGNFPKAALTVPWAIRKGQVVGEYDVPGGVHAYVQTGKTFTTAEPSGSKDSYLSGINVHGLAVGGYCPLGCNAETGQHGYTYDTRTGRTYSFDFPLKGAGTTAFGINDFGVIVGGYCPDSPVCPQGAFNPAGHGFVDDHGVFTTLDFPNAQGTSPFAINDSGTIVGYYDINNTGPHAFLYENGTFTTIDFPGSSYTLATSINNSGAVAGLFANSTGLHGFVYRRGKFTQVDKPGATGTGVTGISDRDELVGVWFPTTGEENFKAIPEKGPTSGPQN